MNKPESRIGFGWIWWVIFPPIAFYHLLRSSLRWYFKVPAILLAGLIAWLAYDMTVSPHRVEEAMAKEKIIAYMEKMKEEDKISQVASLNKSERVGLGTLLVDKKPQSLVYYRVIIDKQLYYFGMNSNKEDDLQVTYVQQQYPIRMMIEGEKEWIQPEISIWLKTNEKKVGETVRLVKESENQLEQTIQTKKGTYLFKVGNQRLYEVKDSQNPKAKYLVKKENVLSLPEVVSDYLKENKKKVGTFNRTLGYELHDKGEWYYFRTDKGDFRAELNYDGTVELKKKR